VGVKRKTDSLLSPKTLTRNAYLLANPEIPLMRDPGVRLHPTQKLGREAWAGERVGAWEQRRAVRGRRRLLLLLSLIEQQLL
jgi:hypothetical protein